MKDCFLQGHVNIRHTQEDTLLHGVGGVAYFRPSTKLRCIAESGAGNLHVPRRLRASAAHPQYTPSTSDGPGLRQPSKIYAGHVFEPLSPDTRRGHSNNGNSRLFPFFSSSSFLFTIFFLFVTKTRQTLVK